MLSITTEKHTLYINIDLLKSRFKSVIITLFKVCTYILVFAGIFGIVWTSWASDSNIITISQTIKQVLQGFFCCGVAWVLNFIKLVIE
jgi:hypothetical protein